MINAEGPREQCMSVSQDRVGPKTTATEEARYKEPDVTSAEQLHMAFTEESNRELVLCYHG